MKKGKYAITWFLVFLMSFLNIGTALAAAPTAPSNVTAVAVSARSIRVNWRDMSSNENYFQVYSTFDKTIWKSVSPENLPANTNTFLDTDSALRPNSFRWYRIYVCNNSGECNFGENTINPSPTYTWPATPLAPNVTTPAGVYNSLDVSINIGDGNPQADNNTAGYKAVKYSIKETTSAPDQFVQSNGMLGPSQVSLFSSGTGQWNTKRVTGLLPGRNYRFAATALNNAGDTALGPEASGQTLTLNYTVAPASFSITDATESSITVLWETGGGDETIYQTYISTDQTNYVPDGTVDVVPFQVNYQYTYTNSDQNNTAFVLKPDTIYYVYAVAVGSTNQPSAAQSGYTDLAATSLTPGTITHNSVDLTLNFNENPSNTEHEILVRNDSTGSTYYLLSGSSTPVFRVQDQWTNPIQAFGLTPETSYTFTPVVRSVAIGTTINGTALQILTAEDPNKIAVPLLSLTSTDNSIGVTILPNGNASGNTYLIGIGQGRMAPPTDYVASPAGDLGVAVRLTLDQWQLPVDIGGRNPLTEYTIYVRVENSLGNSLATMDFISTQNDSTPPTGTVSYSTTNPTNSDVVATLVPSEPGVTVTNNNGSFTYTFTQNGSFIFEFADGTGFTGQTTATVNNIDKTPPTASVSYTTIVPTNGDVVATLQPSESVTVTNNNGSNTYTFTANGSFTFEFADPAGNTGQALATVNNIDKEAPVIFGATDMTITQSTPFDPAFGVTASDNAGSIDLTNQIQITGTVDINTVGNYPLIYEVTDAANNTTSVNRAVRVASASKDITSFSFPQGNGVISGTDIAVAVPFGTNVTALAPTIVITGASVNPVSGAVQDFTNPIMYTVTAENSSTKVYTVTVTVSVQILHTVSGTLKYYDGIKLISGATVILENDQGLELNRTITGANGFYQFTDVQAGDNYIVRIIKNDATTTGLTSADQIKIGRHILGLEPFNLPNAISYKAIAGDVNNSGTLTSADQIKIGRFILNLDSSLQSGAWKFYASDAGLTQANYLTEGLKRVYNNLALDMLNQDFVGIKMGDVNNSWN